VFGKTALRKLGLENQRYVNAGTNAPPPSKRNFELTYLWTLHTYTMLGRSILPASAAAQPGLFKFSAFGLFAPYIYIQPRMVTSALGATALGEGLMNIDEEKGSLHWNKFHLFELYCN